MPHPYNDPNPDWTEAVLITVGIILTVFVVIAALPLLILGSPVIALGGLIWFLLIGGDAREKKE